jgi:hypothetical protein
MLRQLLPLLLSLGASLPAQDVRELSTPTNHIYLTGVSQSTITSNLNNGYRLVDIEYRGPNLLGTTLYDAIMVENTGAYSAAWWWYTGLTSSQVSNNLTTNQARLIDLEPYEDGNGNLRFACIMVQNTGSNAQGWWWYFNTSTSSISTNLSANSARLVDLDSYTLGGTTYYSAVMVQNTGSNSRPWWWYTNATPTQISNLLNTNNARLYSLNKRDNGNFDCIMIRDASIPAWYWWTELTASDVNYLIGQFGVRPIDIESFVVNGARRYSLITINNSNALSTSIGNAMRSRTNGQVGFWLQRINSSNIAYLNGDTVFEPASTMKTLHHVHAMRRVRLGATQLTTLLNVFTNYSGTNSSCPIDTGATTQQLQSVLRMMMEDSDNARTQAVRAFFGEANINNTAAALGMASTSTNHRIGCGADAIANPNRITLRDLHALHEEVANGYLGTFRETFYDLMNDSINALSVASVINSEGAALGLPSQTIASFRNFTRMAHKGGNYGLSNGGPLYYHRAEFGYLSLPFIVNDVITPREYGFGGFVNNADNDSEASSALYTDCIPELLRPTIRQALQSWNNSLAGTISIGSGCGTPTFSQGTSQLPRLGTNVNYVLSGGFPSSLAVLGIGFSSTTWSGRPLPASLTPFGGDIGCTAYIGILSNLTSFANSLGTSQFQILVPNNTAFVGLEYLTQGYTFGGTVFRSTNGLRSIVGF